MGKHFINKKGKSKKIFIFIAIIILLCVIITTVIYLAVQKSHETNLTETEEINETDEIAEILDNLFSALRDGNKLEACKYIDYDKLISSIDEMIVSENDEMLEIEKLLFCEMEWEILEINILDETATAIIEVTNKDFQEVFVNWIQKLIEEKNLDNELTNELILDYFEEILNESNDKKVSSKEISLIKTENLWYVEIDENFRDLIFPGIDTMQELLEKNAN